MEHIKDNLYHGALLGHVYALHNIDPQKFMAHSEAKSGPVDLNFWFCESRWIKNTQFINTFCHQSNVATKIIDKLEVV